MKNPIIMALIAAVIFGAGGLFAGIKYQQSKQTAGFPSNGTFTGQRNGMGADRASGNRVGFQPVNGEIVSSDTNSMTVKLQDGSSKIVLFTDKTPINKASSATQLDLKAGEKVAVFGTTNNDGSVTAQSIQLNPIARMELIPTGATP